MECSDEKKYFEKYSYRFNIIPPNNECKINVLSDKKGYRYYLKITGINEDIWKIDKNELETKDFKEIIKQISQCLKDHEFPNICNCYDTKIFDKIKNKLNIIGRAQVNKWVKRNDYENPKYIINFSSVKIKKRISI